MNVLLWHWGRRGGGPRYSFELARALARQPGIALHTSLSRQSEVYAETAALGLPGMPIDTYATFGGLLLASGRLPGLRRQLGGYIAAQRIDVVLCTMAHLWNAAVAGVIRPAGARYVLTVHDAELHPGERNPLRDIANAHDIRLADRLVALTNHVRDGIVRRHGRDPATIDVIPHGIFDYGAAADPAPRTGSLRLLFFGRLLPYKGLHLLLAAVAELRRAGLPLSLTIAGQGSLSPHRAALAAAGEVEVINRWIGEDEIGPLFRRHDVLVQPYLEASQSGVIPVACAAGLPAIVTPVGGLVEQVQDDVSGLVCRGVEPADIAAAIRRLAGDEPLRRRLGQGARAKALAELDWDRIAPQVAATLTRAMRP